MPPRAATRRGRRRGRDDAVLNPRARSVAISSPRRHCRIHRQDGAETAPIAHQPRNAETDGLDEPGHRLRLSRVYSFSRRTATLTCGSP